MQRNGALEQSDATFSPVVVVGSSKKLAKVKDVQRPDVSYFFCFRGQGALQYRAVQDSTVKVRRNRQ